MRTALSFNTAPTAPHRTLTHTHSNRPATLTLTRRRTPADATASLQKVLSSAVGGQLTLGTALGFATGYAVKRLGQLLLVVVGAEVLALQLMAQRGWVVINWSQISRELSPQVEEGRVERLVDVVRYRVPFAGSFTAGCYAGFRWS